MMCFHKRGSHGAGASGGLVSDQLPAKMPSPVGAGLITHIGPSTSRPSLSVAGLAPSPPAEGGGRRRWARAQRRCAATLPRLGMPRV